MWNILDHDLNSTVGNSSDNLTIKQYTKLCSIQFHVNSKPSHQSDVKERISILSEKLQMQTLFFLFVLFRSQRSTKQPQTLSHTLDWESPYWQKLSQSLPICYYCKYYKLEREPLVGLFHEILVALALAFSKSTRSLSQTLEYFL